jgi:hypothetical protein
MSAERPRPDREEREQGGRREEEPIHGGPSDQLVEEREERGVELRRPTEVHDVIRVFDRHLAGSEDASGDQIAGAAHVRRIVPGDHHERRNVDLTEARLGGGVGATLSAGVIYLILWKGLHFPQDKSYYAVTLSFLLVHYFYDHILFRDFTPLQPTTEGRERIAA